MFNILVFNKIMKFIFVVIWLLLLLLLNNVNGSSILWPISYETDNFQYNSINSSHNSKVSFDRYQDHEDNVKDTFQFYHRQLATPLTQNYTDYWKLLLNTSHNDNRSSYIKPIIASAAGIYDKTKSNYLHKIKQYHTQNTVLVNVISYNKDIQHIRYRQLLQNWYCYASEYDLRPLTYILPNNGTSYDEEVTILESIGIQGDFISYPIELFWSYISNKSREIQKGNGYVDYQGDVPSFQHFGALVMLVPILEVLEQGYDVIYIDLDVTLLRDPIPYLMLGNAEYTLSLEARSCYLPSYRNISQRIDWKSLEPNTGVMRVRSTSQSIDIFRRWLHRNVEDNVSNDQKVFDLEKLGLRLSLECNSQLMLNSEIILSRYIQTLQAKHLIYTKKNITSYPRYCYLNEYLIQNGKVAFHCHLNHMGSQAEYVLAMDEQNFTIYNKHTDRMEKSMIPALVHANYVGDKIMELRRFGLWLHKRVNRTHISIYDHKFEREYHVESHMSSNHSHHRHHSNNSVNTTSHSFVMNTICRPYNYSRTIYAKTMTNWSKAITDAKEEIELLEKTICKNGTVIRSFDHFDRENMLVYYDGRLHPIRNVKVLRKLGINYTETKRLYIPYNFISLYPRGQVLVYNPPTRFPTPLSVITRSVTLNNVTTV